MNTLASSGIQTIGTSAVKVLQKNLNRLHALFVNISADTSIYICLGKPAVVSSSILLVQGGGSYEINLTNPYYGEVWAISSDSEPLWVQEVSDVPTEQS